MSLSSVASKIIILYLNTILIFDIFGVGHCHYPPVTIGLTRSYLINVILVECFRSYIIILFDFMYYAHMLLGTCQTLMLFDVVRT